jgi:uncharacterized protein YndB with AHSA1/START domain
MPIATIELRDMDAVERHVTLPTDLDEAWELLTRPDDQSGWLGAEVELDPTPGSEGLVVDHDGTRRRLVVDHAEAGQRLAWRWWVEGDETAAASEVEITLAPTRDGTLVTVIERPVPGAASASAPARSGTAGEAWSHRLLHLEALLLIAAAVRG